MGINLTITIFLTIRLRKKISTSKKQDFEYNFPFKPLFYYFYVKKDGNFDTFLVSKLPSNRVCNRWIGYTDDVPQKRMIFGESVSILIIRLKCIDFHWILWYNTLAKQFLILLPLGKLYLGKRCFSLFLHPLRVMKLFGDNGERRFFGALLVGALFILLRRQ